MREAWMICGLLLRRINKILAILSCLFACLTILYFLNTHENFLRRFISLRVPHGVINFNFSILPKRIYCNCLRQLVIVQSSPGGFESRMAIRETWGSRQESMIIMKGGAKVMFLLGATEDRSIQEKIVDESSKFNDVIQYSGIDSYRSLVYKSLVMLKYHEIHCPADILVKADDDVLMHLDRLQKRLDFSELSGSPFIGGLVSEEGGTRIIRTKGHKWYVSEESLPGRVYPTYAKGLGYIISREAIPILLNNTKYFKPFEIEDAYVTGVLAKNTKIKFLKMRDGLLYQSKVPSKAACFDGQPITFCVHSFKGGSRLKAGWTQLKNQTCSLP